MVPMPKTQRRVSKKEEAKGKGKGSEGSKGKRKSRQRYKVRIGACFHGGTTAIIQSIRTIVWTTVCRFKSTICRYRSTICGYRCCFNCHTRDASQPLVLHGLFHGNLPFLVESKPNAFFTGSKPAFHTESSASKPNAFTEPKPSTDLMAYSHWHKAFGHVDTFARNKSFYKDGEILPNFIKHNCQPCLLSKSVHHSPEPSLTRAIKPLERIFSDLSGKAPIPGGEYANN